MTEGRAGARVAIIAGNFWPEAVGIGRTVGEFAQFLAQAGVPVVVATSMPYYPEWRIWPAYRGRLWKTDRSGRVTVLRSWHLVARQPSTLTRLLQTRGYATRLVRPSADLMMPAKADIEAACVNGLR